MKKIVYCVSLLLMGFISCSKSGNSQSNDFEMYYRDTVCVDSIFPAKQYPRERYIVWSEDDRIIIDEDKLYLENPDDFSIDLISFKVGCRDSKTTENVYRTIKVKSWIDDVIILKELELENDNSGLINSPKRKSVLYRKYFKFGYVVPMLLTKNDTTYYSDGKDLLWRTSSNEGVCTKGFKLMSSRFNEMIKEGKYGFIRTGNSIFFSNDNLRSWKVVYTGKQAIKESMVYIESDTSIVFSEYTPGNTRPHHHVLKYRVNYDRIDTLVTFYSKAEHDALGLMPYCRHHHVLNKDPYTGDIYIGTGDLDYESRIMRSSDGGNTFVEIGTGSQIWRTITLVYSDKYIYWGTDSRHPQYISCLKRDYLNDSLPVSESQINQYPLINSAIYHSIAYKDLYLVSSNSEGELYDDKHRIYALSIDENGAVTAYSCIAESSETPNNQLFILGIDCENTLWVCDTKDNYRNRRFEIIDKRKNR